MSKVEEIIEQLKSLTLLEAAELVKSIEETFDVSAASGGGGAVVMAAAPVAGGGDAEEKTEFDLVLEEVPADKKIAVLKVVRGITGLGQEWQQRVINTGAYAIKHLRGHHCNRAWISRRRQQRENAATHRQNEMADEKQRLVAKPLVMLADQPRRGRLNKVLEAQRQRSPHQPVLFVLSCGQLRSQRDYPRILSSKILKMGL